MCCLCPSERTFVGYFLVLEKIFFMIVIPWDWDFPAFSCVLFIIKRWQLHYSNQKHNWLFLGVQILSFFWNVMLRWMNGWSYFLLPCNFGCVIWCLQLNSQWICCKRAETTDTSTKLLANKMCIDFSNILGQKISGFTKWYFMTEADGWSQEYVVPFTSAIPSRKYSENKRNGRYLVRLGVWFN